MSTYLLLRNNKETGPHTLEGLLALGLKAYDLVWVEGKSAAWRYPGEVQELKAYAPMMEEQPFDRFFKKTGTEKQEKKEEPQKEEKPTEIKPSFVPKKSVFVTLPGKSAVAASTPVQKKETVPQTEIVASSPVISIKENPVVVETKFSQPLDEIKELYVKTLQDRKHRSARKIMMTVMAKKAAVIVLIAGVGVLIGFSMRSKKDDKLISVAPATQPVQPVINLQDEETPAIPVEEIITQSDPVPVSPQLSADREEHKPLFISTEKPALPKTVIDKSSSSEKKEPVVTEKRIAAEQLPSPGVETDSRTGERNRRVREEGNVVTKSSASVNEPKATLSNNSNELSRMVTLKSNDYHIVAFGGIRNLQLTVFNDSKYVLDKVIVELQYLKPSEQPLKTENIEFKSVSPGGSMTIKVPDSNRGIKVLYKITQILSTQSAKDFAG